MVDNERPYFGGDTPSEGGYVSMQVRGGGFSADINRDPEFGSLERYLFEL